MNKKYEIDMTNGAIMPKLVGFFLPLMTSSILQLLFNAVDLIVVGNFAGSDPLAAVGATTSLINMVTAVFVGVSLGANVITARFFACDDRQNMDEAVHTAISIALIFGVVLAFAGIIFARPALRLMDTPENVIDMSALYMMIYFCGMPFFMVYNYSAAILRAVGDTKRPLYFLIIAGVMNAVLNMVMVIVFSMGVAGVAIATVFSQLVSSLLTVSCLVKTDSSYKLNPSRLRINVKILRQMLSIGLPAGIQSMVINFSNVQLQSSVNSFGSVAMAGYTAANSVLGFLYMSINSVTQACMSFTSQNFGVAKYDRMRRVLLDCLALECMVGVCLGGLAYIFGPQILAFYTDSEEVVASGMQVLSITTWTYFLCGIMDCLPGHLRGMGHSGIPMILSVIGTVGTRIVWIYGLFPYNRSIDFLFISYPASWIITIVLQLICMNFVYHGIRKKM